MARLRPGNENAENAVVHSPPEGSTAYFPQRKTRVCRMSGIERGYPQTPRFRSTASGQPAWSYTTLIVEFIEPHLALLSIAVNTDGATARKGTKQSEEPHSNPAVIRLRNSSFTPHEALRARAHMVRREMRLHEGKSLATPGFRRDSRYTPVWQFSQHIDDDADSR
jgi:hypothetical protein